MKKLGLLAMAFALVMTMTQCKKEKMDVPASEGEKVNITLDVHGGNGSRAYVNPESGEVSFSYLESLYVISGGHYVGKLSYNGYYFTGSITNPTEGEPLHFYLISNLEETLVVGSSTGCSVVISDQTTLGNTNYGYPVISYAPSREDYEEGRTSYSATLLNKCALVKFNVTTEAGTATYIKGMNNKVTIDFSTNEFEYSQEDEGIIALSSGNGEKWAILLPQDEVTNPEVCSADGVYSGTCGTIPSIVENDYLNEGISVTIDELAITFNDMFTINLNGGQVYFSQGNLQYQASTNTWRFAENQWDAVGNDNANISETYDGWIDLFGWGTSGYNHGAVCYQPWSTSTSYSDYNVYGNLQYNLYDQTGQADWGYNPISNGGNIENSGWRTLTNEEWQFMLKERTTNSNRRYAKATVNDVKGLIILPDNWDLSTYTLTWGTNDWYSNFTDNIVSATDWINVFEANGAVFLPMTGRRNQYTVSVLSDRGYYWSSSRYASYDDYGCCVSFYRRGVDVTRSQRNYGCSVRLVHNVE
jgi:hypothetical protein